MLHKDCLFKRVFYVTDFDLGTLQFGDGRVDDVILPRWASTPYEFIHKHRMALVGKLSCCFL